MSKDRDTHRMFQDGGTLLDDDVRDMIAIVAMLGFLSQRTSDDGEADERTFDFIAEVSYRMSDAMLRARHKAGR
jgi:hypothetical protein